MKKMIEMKQKKGIKAMNTNKKISNETVYTDMPIITAPLIDKLAGVVDMKDEKLHGFAYSVVIDWLNSYEEGIVKVPVAGKYQLAVRIHYPDDNGIISVNGPFILLQLTHPKVSKRQIRFEYNPSRLTENGEEYLRVMIQELTGQEFYEFLGHARFTRIDVCQNIMFRSMEDYLIKAKWKKSSQCFFSPEGKLQTINLGKSGNNQISAYDKAAQLHGNAATHSTIRIEARCRINLTIDGLAKFSNPLANVEIYSVTCDNPPYGKAHWSAFQDSCHLRGVSNAIKKTAPFP